MILSFEISDPVCRIRVVSLLCIAVLRRLLRSLLAADCGLVFQPLLDDIRQCYLVF